MEPAPENGERLQRIESLCARVSEFLELARRLEAEGHVAMASAARDLAADLLGELKRPRPATPRHVETSGRER